MKKQIIVFELCDNFEVGNRSDCKLCFVLRARFLREQMKNTRRPDVQTRFLRYRNRNKFRHNIRCAKMIGIGDNFHRYKKERESGVNSYR